MNFTHTIKQLIAKADPSQASQLQELSNIERPNSIQIATLNEIKLAIAKSQKKLQIINELKNKITNRGLSLAENIETYPLDKINRFKTILDNQSFLENQSEFLDLIGFLFPQDDSIYTLFEKLTNKESLDTDTIEIEDFSTYTQEDFQEEKIQEPRIIVSKKSIITPKHKVQASQIEITKKFSKLDYLITKSKRSICITLCLIIYHTTIRKTPNTYTQTQNSGIDVISDAILEGTCSTPDTLENITQREINYLYNNYKVDFKEYVAGFEDTNNRHFQQHMQFYFIIEKMDTELNQINNLSPYPVLVRMNFIDSTSKEEIFSNTSIERRPTLKHQRNPESTNFRYLVNMNIEGFVYNVDGQSSFVPTNINILNPVMSESDIEEKYFVRYL